MTTNDVDAGNEPTPPFRSGRARALSWLIRKITGVHEELLDRIPAERTRYTALAAVMICTASIGGFSMFFALSEILGRAQLWFLPLAAFWSVFVLCIDCWLVSSTAGTRWRTRISVLLPRLAIAAVFGVVIAEPLVLRIFQTGVDAHIVQTRQADIDSLRSRLVKCNPIPGISTSAHPPAATACSGMTLNIPNPAAATLARLQALESQATVLLSQVNKETSQLTTLQNNVNDECNGDSGNGLTGQRGDGPACDQDQRYVTTYLAGHPIKAQSAQLARIQNQIRSLRGRLSDEQGNDRNEIAQAITLRLNNETRPDATIGMAERFEALSYLSLTNPFIAVASWFVRIFFVLIDCLPVLVKFISGSTPYDRFVETEISAAERRFGRDLDLQEAIVDGENALKLRAAKADIARRRKEIDLRILRQDAERTSNKEDAVDELYERKLKAWRSPVSASSAPSDTAGWPIEPDRTVAHPNGSSTRHDDIESSDI